MCSVFTVVIPTELSEFHVVNIRNIYADSFHSCNLFLIHKKLIINVIQLCRSKQISDIGFDHIFQFHHDCGFPNTYINTMSLIERSKCLGLKTSIVAYLILFDQICISDAAVFGSEGNIFDNIYHVIYLMQYYIAIFLYFLQYYTSLIYIIYIYIYIWPH